MVANLAVIQEIIAKSIPDREAILWGDRRFTYAELNRRSRQLAQAFRQWGIGCHKERAELQPWESGQDHVALYLYNGNEYLEGMCGAFKVRAAAVNINYRYVEQELRYVLENAGARVIIFHSGFAPRLAAVRKHLPTLEYFIQVPDDSEQALLDGAVWYEELLAAQPGKPLDLAYSGDDLYILYTGGTTGLPKGVLWRHEDVFYNGLGGHLPGFDRLDTEEKLVKHINLGLGGRLLICAPFMHGTGHWFALNTFHRGGTVVLPEETRRLDAHMAWQAVERHRVDQLGMVGDAFARPLLDALEERAYDVSSVGLAMSTGAVLSPSVKERLLRKLPDTLLFVESIGGSEMGLQAMSHSAGRPEYALRDNTVILSDDRTRVLKPEEGTTEIGWIASIGHLPLGYLGDAEKTRQTFPTINEVRHVVSGDRARYEDGRVVFLGRESVCINTGGEKVYVEEVERVVKSHPAVYDALVVGVPHERWGQQVTAVLSLSPGSTAPDPQDLRAHCQSHLADYKIPRAVVVAPEIVRSPSGKPDYTWAKEFATAEGSLRRVPSSSDDNATPPR